MSCIQPTVSFSFLFSSIRSRFSICNFSNSFTLSDELSMLVTAILITKTLLLQKIDVLCVKILERNGRISGYFAEKYLVETN